MWCCAVLLGGCHAGEVVYLFEDNADAHYRGVATEIEYANVSHDGTVEADFDHAPRTLWNHELAEYWDLPLEEAVQLALATSQVISDLGGRVIRSPDSLATVYDPAIQESDPRYGVEGALSRFDTRFATQVFWERNDRVLNNLLIGGGTRLLDQDLGQFQSEISKQAATGTQVALRHNVNYDWNNRTVNTFPSAWQANFEAEVRHPFGQGGGVEFNRIAGPGARPGLLFQNGVLLARIDNDISLAQFEAGVRNLVSDVENAYWDLYFAYRNLDAKVAARDSALETWRRVKRLKEAGERGGEAAVEAQAAGQYFFFRAEVENALSGASGASTRNSVGTSSGTFLGAGGVYARENDLRKLIGLPISDDRLLRPSEEPTSARVVFDWNEILGESLVRRVELRRQKWQIKRHEMELIAARNFTKPRLDAVGRYRWRGFGDDLIDSNSSGSARFDNAYQDLTDGDFQEWQLGFQFEMPLGFREGYAGVRQSQLKLARARAVLTEQERQVAHDLAGALRELHRSDIVRQSNFDERRQAHDQLEALRREFDAGRPSVDRILEAQKVLADAEVRYFRATVAHTLAIKAVHFEKGTLLEYDEVHLAEGPWPAKAYRDSERRARARSAGWPIDYTFMSPGAISKGAAPQIMKVVPAPKNELVEPGRTSPEPLPLPGGPPAADRSGREQGPLPDAERNTSPAKMPPYPLLPSDAQPLAPEPLSVNRRSGAPPQNAVTQVAAYATVQPASTPSKRPRFQGSTINAMLEDAWRPTTDAQGPNASMRRTAILARERSTSAAARSQPPTRHAATRARRDREQLSMPPLPDDDF